MKDKFICRGLRGPNALCSAQSLCSCASGHDRCRARTRTTLPENTLHPMSQARTLERSPGRRAHRACCKLYETTATKHHFKESELWTACGMMKCAYSCACRGSRSAPEKLNKTTGAQHTTNKARGAGQCLLRGLPHRRQSPQICSLAYWEEGTWPG